MCKLYFLGEQSLCLINDVSFRLFLKRRESRNGCHMVAILPELLTVLLQWGIRLEKSVWDMSSSCGSDIHKEISKCCLGNLHWEIWKVILRLFLRNFLTSSKDFSPNTEVWLPTTCWGWQWPEWKTKCAALAEHMWQGSRSWRNVPAPAWTWSCHYRL